MVTKFQARHLTGAYASSAVTYDDSTNLEDETYAGNIAELKNLEITPPEQAVEQVRCAGNVAQTIGANARAVGTATGVTNGTWQNMMLHHASPTNWKVTGTALLTGDEQSFHILGLGTSDAIGGSDNATRYGVGTLASDAFDQNMVGAIRASYDNGSERVVVALTNIFIGKHGPVRPTGADGHFEVDFEGECLPKDGAWEFKD